MRLRHCPPISILTTPYTFTPPPLPSLHLRSALPTCSRHCLPSLRLQSALPTCSRHHLSLRLCSALPTLLTILTLAECPPNTAYHPYACGVHSRHAPDNTYP
ncbi:hypothetical protein O181_089291 [Austropuccinia psidii MF-1]|uniref:Uncharacterized protein n=1 Tax=Austropuccinia psidii MF-1 TaxID=1389203 RepID=A0A9Q3P7P3_9BASI|nr:hypothetical protein [Austropuccinia psidii MF-1]